MVRKDHYKSQMTNVSKILLATPVIAYGAMFALFFIDGPAAVERYRMPLESVAHLAAPAAVLSDDRGAKFWALVGFGFAPLLTPAYYVRRRLWGRPSTSSVPYFGWVKPWHIIAGVMSGVYLLMFPPETSGDVMMIVAFSVGSCFMFAMVYRTVLGGYREKTRYA